MTGTVLFKNFLTNVHIRLPKVSKHCSNVMSMLASNERNQSQLLVNYRSDLMLGVSVVIFCNTHSEFFTIHPSVPYISD